MGRSTAERAAADLEAAAALIRHSGWQRTGGGSCNTGFCASDALARVVHGDTKRYWRAVEALAEHVNTGRSCRISRNPRSAVIVWNDVYARSVTEVDDAMQATAAALR